MLQRRFCLALKSGVRLFSRKSHYLEVSDEVTEALRLNRPVVALESTIITHGMPFPQNVECALEVEETVRSQNVVPATIALLNGTVKVGLSRKEIEILGDTKVSRPVKTSRRDFPYVLSNKLSGGTTVAGTLVVCNQVGIRIFATGGIGGVHRGASETFDISADLTELGRCNVAVVSSGVKSILDIAKTLEYLETQGVFVATFGPTTTFPAFYSRLSAHNAPYCVETASAAAQMIKAHKDMQLESGMLFGVPVPEPYAFDPESINRIIDDALAEADIAGISGKNITPFLLKQIAGMSAGSSLETNIALIKNNAKTAAEIAVCLAHLERHQEDAKPEEKLPLSKRPVIIGGCNLDCVVHLEADELKLDGRIHAGRFDYSAGGVGRNICEALSKLNCPAHLISAIGDDHQGNSLLKHIPQESQRYIAKLPEENTAQCIVVVDKKGDCRFLLGDMHIHEKISLNMVETHEKLIKDAPLIVMDGNIGIDTMDKVLEMALKYNVPVFYEPTDIGISCKPFKTAHWKAIKFISPNIGELYDIADCLKIRPNLASGELDKIAKVAGSLASYIDNVLVTLGPEGVLIARKGSAQDSPMKQVNIEETLSVRHYPVQEKTKVVNVSGAGDCFASGFIAGLLQNCSERQCVSVGFATAVAALKSPTPVPEAVFKGQRISGLKQAGFTVLN